MDYRLPGPGSGSAFRAKHRSSTILPPIKCS
jgi:hypothetical protein